MIPKETLATHVKILAQIQLNYISELKANNFFTGTFKNFTNNFIKQLIQVEAKFFDKAIDQQEEATTACYDVADEYYKMVSSVPIWDMQNIVAIVKAYNKDKKSIEGICNKILK